MKYVNQRCALIARLLRGQRLVEGRLAYWDRPSSGARQLGRQRSVGARFEHPAQAVRQNVGDARDMFEDAWLMCRM